jgi:CubicO group peptidase (beta-lactamase class C family)
MSIRGSGSRASVAMRRWMVAVSLLALCAPSMAAKPALPAPWTQLVGMYDATLEKDRMVGGSIALVENGKIVARHDYGYADKANGRRVDADTIFHWASITKTLNGIAVMQLRDRGQLSLDEPITRYVPELRQMHNPFGSMDAITIRMLLTHSAGFQDSTWPYRRYLDWEPFEPTRWEQLVAMMPYQEIEFAPGSKSSYSNPAWIYLARALEDLSGDPWKYYVQKNIFTPLGMSRSYFGHTPPHLRAQRSSRYMVSKGEDGNIVMQDLGGEFDPGITIPNGGWNAPLADVATYIAFLTGVTNGDAQVQQRYDSVLKRSTLEEMWQPRFPSEMWEKTEQMGLAFFLSEHGTHRIIGHTGSQAGYSTFFYCDPLSKRGIIGAFNTANGARGEEPSAMSIIRNNAVKVFD